MSTLNILSLIWRCAFFSPGHKQAGAGKGAAGFLMPSWDLPGWYHPLCWVSSSLLVLLGLSPSGLRAFAPAVPPLGLRRLSSYSRPSLQGAPPSCPPPLHPQTPTPSGLGLI